MKFKELVPDIELCKLIPKGEFKDSALAWSVTTRPYYEGDVAYCETVCPRDRLHLQVTSYTRSQEIYPAPTLQEIMAELPSCVCYRMNEEWSVGLVNDSAENAIKDSSGATAALKLWLKTKGIDYDSKF